jgi:hypothetical protein
MIMQYEDCTRKDIVVNLETEGLVKRRDTVRPDLPKVSNAHRVAMA